MTSPARPRTATSADQDEEGGGSRKDERADRSDGAQDGKRDGPAQKPERVQSGP